MRVVIAVDWSEEAFAAVKQVAILYRLEEATLVHAVDLGTLDNPALGPAMSQDVFSDVRQAMVDSGERLLAQTAALLPDDVKATRLCEIGTPAGVVLDTIQSARPDLVALGARGRGMIAELLLGSVSHRVLMHATCPTFIVKGTSRDVQHVMVAVEGPEDASRMQAWLLAHPFKPLVKLSAITVVPRPAVFGSAANPLSSDSLLDHASQNAQQLLDEVVTSLKEATIEGAGDVKVLVGDPVDRIVQETERCDLLVVGSHGRHGLNRFLLGSVSHALVHRVGTPVLVLR